MGRRKENGGPRTTEDVEWRMDNVGSRPEDRRYMVEDGEWTKANGGRRIEDGG